MAKRKFKPPMPILVDLDLPPSDLFVRFANTGEPREEHPRHSRRHLGVMTQPLNGYDAITRWMVEVGGLTQQEQLEIQQMSDEFPPDAIDEALVLVGLRPFCLKVAELRADGKWPSDEDYAFLRREVSSFAPPWTFVPRHGGSWTMPRGKVDLRRPYRQLIFSMVHLLSTARHVRVKRCQYCDVLFADSKRRYNRKFCHRDVCGVKSKNENRLEGSY